MLYALLPHYYAGAGADAAQAQLGAVLGHVAELAKLGQAEQQAVLGVFTRVGTRAANLDKTQFALFITRSSCRCRSGTSSTCRACSRVRN